ncbi:MAG: hypothetical protein KBH90_10990, partial [Bacteroidales bacterium]|nr:hypothetical protein [Bacteroidales bacterium]
STSDCRWQLLPDANPPAATLLTAGCGLLIPNCLLLRVADCLLLVANRLILTPDSLLLRAICRLTAG